ncbi:hypothetical protein ES703_109820 [subsurface metagenome]
MILLNLVHKTLFTSLSYNTVTKSMVPPTFQNMPPLKVKQRPFHNPYSDRMWPARQSPSLSAMAGGLPLLTCQPYKPGLPAIPARHKSGGPARHPAGGWQAGLGQGLFSYSTISLITPAPTVFPPSRIAKRSSFSMAMGVIRFTSRATLSPGITISTPSGRVTTAVTSVVRK